MPLYEYQCIKCDHQFEKLLKFSESDAAVSCEKCGKKTKRLISQCFGTDGNEEPWQYEYTHSVKPKFVRDSKGNRHKFNPNTMGKGRKGQG